MHGAEIIVLVNIVDPGLSILQRPSILGDHVRTTSWHQM